MSKEDDAPFDPNKSLNEMSPADRRRKLQTLMNRANKDIGRPNLLVFAEQMASPYFLRRPTGITQLDVDLGGGWPAGTVNYLSGPENAGKTWLLFKTYAMHQRLYGVNSSIAHGQIEGAFDYFFLRKAGYKVAIPMNVIEEHQEHRRARKVPLMTKAEVKDMNTGIGEFMLIVPSTMEELTDWTLEIVQSGLSHIIGVDSITAAMPSAEAMLATFGDYPQQGAHATLMKRFLQHYYPLASGTRGLNETTLIFINQVVYNRDKGAAPAHMQKYLKDWKPAGAPAAKHGKSIDLMIWSGEKLRGNAKKGKAATDTVAATQDEKAPILGKEMQWQIAKGKAGTHDNIFGSQSVYYIEDSITQNLKSVMSAGVKYGVLREKEGKYTLLNATTMEHVPGLEGVEGYDIFMDLMRADKDVEIAVRREILAGAKIECRYK